MGKEPDVEALRLLQYASSDEMKEIASWYNKPDIHDKYVKSIKTEGKERVIEGWKTLIKEAALCLKLEKPNRVHFILLAVYLKGVISIQELASAFRALAAAKAKSNYKFYYISSFNEMKRQLLTDDVVLEAKDEEKLKKICGLAQRVPENQRFFILIDTGELSHAQQNVSVATLDNVFSALLWDNKENKERKKKNPDLIFPSAWTGIVSFEIKQKFYDDFYEEKKLPQIQSVPVLGLSERMGMILRQQQYLTDSALILPSVAPTLHIHAADGYFFWPDHHEDYHDKTRAEGYTYRGKGENNVRIVAEKIERKNLAMDPFTIPLAENVEANPVLLQGATEADLKKWLVDMTAGAIVDGSIPDDPLGEIPNEDLVFPNLREMRSFWHEQIGNYLLYAMNQIAKTPITEALFKDVKVEKAKFSDEVWEKVINEILKEMHLSFLHKEL